MSNGDVNSPINEGVSEGINTIGQGAMMTFSSIQGTSKVVRVNSLMCRPLFILTVYHLVDLHSEYVAL